MNEQNAGTRKNRNASKTLIFTMAIFILSIPVILLILNVTGYGGLNHILPYFLGIITALSCIQLVILIRFFAGLELIKGNAHILSGGKLNISDILADKTKGLETLAVAFNDMKSNLLNFIESTKRNVIILSDSIENVTRSIDMSYKGNEQIASSMTAVAEKAQEQLQIVQNTIDRIEEVSNRIGNITTSLANIDKFVETTVTMTLEGLEYLDSYNEQMKSISGNLGDTSSFIVALNSRLKEIDQISSLIVNITEQLQLLSLNSSIEAARAGSAGKGFVVVAQEMSKLSQATLASVEQINEQISGITDSNAKVIESIDECVDSYNRSEEVFQSVKESFHTINRNANILSTDMRKVYEDSLLINENTKEISDRGKVLYDASNEISSITQDVAAVTEEELAGNVEISNQAASLQNMLSAIGVLLSKYKTSVVPVKGSSARSLKIVMISPLDHPFWESVRQGALYAKSELKSKNADVDYVGLEQMENEKFKALFSEKLEGGCDGIVIPGFIGGIEPYIEKANRMNIPVVAFNCDLPAGVKRLAYFGPDVNAYADLGGELTLKCLGGSGEVAIFRGNLIDSINKIRRDKVVAALKRKRKVKIVAEVEAVDDNTLVYGKVKEVLDRFPELNGIVITSGGVPGAARAIEELGRVGRTKIVCFDYDPEILELINKGIVYAALGQDPFGQGHDPIIALYNYLAADVRMDEVNYTRNEVIDIRNADK